jgi:hypothetical protein
MTDIPMLLFGFALGWCLAMLTMWVGVAIARAERRDRHQLPGGFAHRRKAWRMVGDPDVSKEAR